MNPAAIVLSELARIAAGYGPQAVSLFGRLAHDLATQRPDLITPGHPSAPPEKGPEKVDDYVNSLIEDGKL